MAAPEVGLALMSLPPWLVPTIAEACPAKVGVTVTVVSP